MNDVSVLALSLLPVAIGGGIGLVVVTAMLLVDSIQRRLPVGSATPCDEFYLAMVAALNGLNAAREELNQ